MHPDPAVNGDSSDRLPPIDVSAAGDGFIVIDLAEANQRELERRVAEGEALPEGFTPESVAAWRAEHPHAPIVIGGVDSPGVELIPFDTEAVAAEVGVDDRCTAACGLPADPDAASRAKTSCPVHPDGAHRCYRRPRHQYGQADETDGRLSAADHECDCGAVWLCLVGGMAAHADTSKLSGDRRRDETIRLMLARVNRLHRHRGLTGRAVLDLDDVRRAVEDVARVMGMKIDGE